MSVGYINIRELEQTLDGDILKALESIEKNNLYLTLQNKRFPLVIRNEDDELCLNHATNLVSKKTIINIFATKTNLAPRTTPQTNSVLQSTRQLSKIFIATPQDIYQELKKTFAKQITTEDNRPIVITKTVLNKEEFFLNLTGDFNIDTLIKNLFATQSGLQLKDTTISKTPYLKQAHELTSTFVASSYRILESLKSSTKLSATINNKKYALVAKAIDNGKEALYLNLTGDAAIDHKIIKKFASQNNLLPIFNKTKHMMSIYDLVNTYLEGPNKILSKMKELSATTIALKDNITLPLITKAISKKNIILCLNLTGDPIIDKQIKDSFTNKAGLTIRHGIIKKNQHMKSAVDLKKMYLNQKQEISEALKKLATHTITTSDNKQRSLVIKAKSTTILSLYLNLTGNLQLDQEIISNFTNLSGLTPRDSVVLKNQYMLSAPNLSSYFYSSKDDIYKKMYLLQENKIIIDNQELSLIINAKTKGKRNLYLNQTGNQEIDAKILQEFTTQSNLTPRKDIIQKSQALMSAEELTTLFINTQQKILQSLHKNKEQLILINNQEKPLIVKVKGPKKTFLCLNLNGSKEDKEVIAKFAQLSGLTLRNSLPKKTHYMKHADELMSVFIDTHSKIYTQLNKLKNDYIEINGKKIPLVSQVISKKGECICLNLCGNKKIDNQIINDFAKKANLTTRESIIPKTKYMQTSQELTALFTASRGTIGSYLKQFQDHKVTIKDKEIPLIIYAKTQKRRILCLNLCSNQQTNQIILSEFIKLSNLKQRKQSAASLVIAKKMMPSR